MSRSQQSMRSVTIRFAAIAALGLIIGDNGVVRASLKPDGPRQVVLLDGVWQVEQGDMETPPAAYGHTVSVPGLVDMAQPAFADVGKKSLRRNAFWYRHTFRIRGEIPAVAILKLHKAKYGVKVWLNGQVVGESLACFTPVYFDVKSPLRGGGRENELVVRIGAHRELLPQDTPTGWDFEKYLFLPGIYDSVELILTGKPYIRNVQIVPNIEQSMVRVVAEVDCGDSSDEIVLSGKVTPAKATDTVGRTRITLRPAGGEVQKADFVISVPKCRLWSPEDPFLYELHLGTGGDAARVRFGMRTFRFDPETKRAILNGKPYYLRGSNVTVYRFFEDELRGDLPWRREWVRKLHRRFKWMHFNSLRYCIGFPPEFWYDIADEEGILIQDEFPIWLLAARPEWPVAEKIIPQYTDWMRERWNHPCVVIWDAQNESVTPETGKALQAVRHLDLSGRPWENGWSEPQSLSDCVEAHPYLFIRTWAGGQPFRMSEMATLSGVPHLRPAQRKLPATIIVNEYAWLCLTRDGNPTCMSKKVYEDLLGQDSTVEQRRRIFARYQAAMTEFWRAHRECAGVMEFCGLGYSRPGDVPRPEGGATSDHFGVDIEKLEFEPFFVEYVRDAFNPVGLMLDFWAEKVPAGSSREMKVYVINDLDKDWQGDVRLRLIQGQQSKLLDTRATQVASLGREILSFTVTMPTGPGDYTLVGELQDHQGQTIRSRREFEVVGQ